MRLRVFGSDLTGQAYPPHPTQSKIFDWVVEKVAHPDATRIPVLYVQHGVRSGGTRGILNAVLARLYHEPGLRCLIARRDFNDLRKSIMETFFEIVPPEDIVERDLQEHRYVLQGKNGTSTVYFSGIKDVGGLGSQEFGLISLHEVQESSHSVYQRLKPRASQRGYSPMILMEGNAPIEGDWLDQLTTPNSRLYDPDLERIIMPTTENWQNLDLGFRESLERMDAAWKRRFVMGLSGFIPSGTPVYPSFVESLHVRETALIPDRPLIRGWDFGLRRAACLWGQVAANGQLVIHREWSPLETPESQFIAGVKLRTNDWFGDRVCRDYGDPAATHRDPEGVQTLRRLKDAGIHLVYRQTTYGERIPLINRKLSELIPGEAIPSIVINPSCRTLIEALDGGWHYPELKEGQEFNQRRDLPYRDGWFEHLANAFEYIMVNLFGGGVSESHREQRREVTRSRKLQRRERRGLVSF